MKWKIWYTSSTRTRRGGSCLKDIYKTFLIYRTCMRRAPAKPVRACTLRNWCLVSHVTFEAPRHTSHLTVFTLHTALFTLHSSHCTLRSQHFTSHCTLKIPHFTLHTSQSFPVLLCTKNYSLPSTYLKGKLPAPKLKKSADKSLSQPGCSHSNTNHAVQLQKTIVLVLRMQPRHRATLTQPLQCDLQRLSCKTQ